MRSRIIIEAERLLSERGYHGWSYANIAVAIGIKKASIHYHFPKKADLGRELIHHYKSKAMEGLVAIDASCKTPLAKLYALADLFGQVLKKGNAFCLCGMLTADFLTLPKMMKEELIEFFKLEEHWIQQVLQKGKEVHGWEMNDAQKRSSLIMSCLQGLLLLARLEEDPYASYTELSQEFIKGGYGVLSEKKRDL